MGKKAVYNNKGLGIYITGEDFEELLERTNASIPVFIGKVQTKKSFVWITVSVEALADLVNAFTLERDAIDEVRDKFKKDPPNYSSADSFINRS